MKLIHFTRRSKDLCEELLYQLHVFARIGNIYLSQVMRKPVYATW